MESFLLQDWVAVGAAASTSLVQSVGTWLDAGELADVVFWLQLAQVSGASVPLYYETSPTRDESLFVSLMPSIDLATASQTAVTVSSALVQTPNVPPCARFVRWRVAAAVDWTALFRIYVTGRRGHFR